jgi:hypothetical protein
MTEIIKLWRIFMKEWVAKQRREATPEGMMLKPSFYDFMDWVSENSDEHGDYVAGG